MFLENAKAIVNFDNIIATTLSEARKNGAEITKSNMYRNLVILLSYTLVVTMQIQDD